MNTWIFMMEQIYVWKRNFGSCRSQMLFKIDVFENFANFTGRHLYWSRFLIKMLCSGLQVWNRLLRRCFPLKFAKFFTTPFLQSSSGECFCDLRVLSPLYLKRSKSILLPTQNGGKIQGMVYLSWEFKITSESLKWKSKIKANQGSNKTYCHCIILFWQMPRQIFFHLSVVTLNL